MHTLELEALPDPQNEILQYEQTFEISDDDKLSTYKKTMSTANQSELKTTKSELTTFLGEIEGEMSNDPDKESNSVLVDLSIKTRAKILIVTNFIDGNTNS